MLISGIILIVLGIVSIFAGNNINNDIGRQIESFWESGEVNTGDIFIIFGYGLIILGVIFTIIGLVKNSQKNNAVPFVNYCATNVKMFKCCRCGYIGFYGNTCPVCKSKNTMLPYNDNIQPQNASHNNNGSRSPSCGAVTVTGSKFCGTCGKSLSDKKRCPSCGVETEFEALFCSNCGDKLN